MTCDRRSFRVVAYRPDNGHCWPTQLDGGWFGRTWFTFLRLSRATPARSASTRRQQWRRTSVFTNGAVSLSKQGHYRCLVLGTSFHRVNGRFEGCCACFLAALWLDRCLAGIAGKIEGFQMLGDAWKGLKLMMHRVWWGVLWRGKIIPRNFT